MLSGDKAVSSVVLILQLRGAQLMMLAAFAQMASKDTQ